ncbi:MAG: HTH domain-containing protein [Candidatus Njordarchaeales archaeon]
MSRIKNLEKAIIELLKKSTIGLTTSDIAEKLGVSRLTIMKYLQALKGRGLIIDRKVGAYKLWILKNTLERKRRLISRRLACVLASVFAKIFTQDTETVAFNVGRNLAKEFIRRYPEDYSLIEKVPRSPFEKIALVIEFISEDLRAEGFEIEENRGIVRLKGLLCEDNVASNSLMNLIAGAIVGFLEVETGKDPKIVNTKVTKSNEEFEVLFEIILNETT